MKGGLFAEINLPTHHGKGFLKSVGFVLSLAVSLELCIIGDVLGLGSRLPTASA